MPRSTHTHLTARARRRLQAGFTLLELMVVVIMVGILAVMAVPGMSAAAIDRHVYEDAANIQDLIREARARAIGRGGGVMIAMSTKTGPGLFRTYEIRSDLVDGGANLPLTHCKAPSSWADVSTLREVRDANMQFPYEVSNNISAKIYGPAGTLTDEAYLCFSPAGHTYYSKTPNFDGDTALTAGLRVEVKHLNSAGDETVGIVRNVLIPPSGAARLVSGSP